MKKLIISILWMIPVLGIAQKPGYYNGTSGKTGTELKTALHQIINNHVDFSYSDAKYIMNYADEDPANTNNLILFYTKRSQSKDSWGSGSNDINREHVWAKSHGDFSDVRPMDGDAYNLHPADASVNITRSNYDFDECSDVGTLIAEAGAYYTSSQFEPPDAAKGEVARTIFYMAVRYEGTAGELDLEVVDRVNTSPAPEHGKLSTLLQWNRDFPPTDLERRRNERVFHAQRNRNPFIDHPEFADLIWGEASLSSIQIDNIQFSEEYPEAGSLVGLSSTITGNNTAVLYYGKTWNSETEGTGMTQSGSNWTAEMDLSSFSQGDMLYFKIAASDGTKEKVFHGNYLIPSAKTITSIASVQGTGLSTPFSGSVISIGGVVTANFDNSYYIQDSNSTRSGICVYGILRGKEGDSVVVTGRATEYNNLTELDNVTYTYVYTGKGMVEPVEITIPQAAENYEGMLVLLKNVTFLEGDAIIPVSEAMTLHLTDGQNTITAYSRYNSRLGGHKVPSGTVNVKAVLSQYQGTYQLLINDIEDISSGDDSDPPMITGVIVNDASWIEVSFSEKLDKSSAELVANYNISDGVEITGAYIYNDTKVLLFVNGLREQDYVLTVSNVADLKGNAITQAVYNFHSPYSSLGTGNFQEEPDIVWPNPSSGLLYIRNQENSAASWSVDIYSANGILIYSAKDIQGEVLKLQPSNMENGLYILRVYSGQKTRVAKLVIRK